MAKITKNKKSIKDKALEVGKIRKVPKNVQDTIPYTHIFNDGIIETRPGTFTKSYRMDDINFQIATDEQQLQIFGDYMSFLNSFDQKTRWQIVIHNHSITRSDVLKKIRIKPQQDGLNYFRQEMNSVLLGQTAKGKSSLEQEKYLVVSVDEKDFEQANSQLKKLDIDVAKNLGKVTGTNIKPQSTEERLKVLYSIYNQDETDKSIIENEEFLSLENLAKQGLTTKDIIGPSSFNFSNPSIYNIGDTYAQSLYVENIPSFLSTNFLSDLTDISSNMLISLNFEPTDPQEAIKTVRSQLASLEAQVYSKDKAASDDGTGTFLPPELEKAYKNAKELMNDLMSRNQKIFFISITISVFAETKEQLLENVALVRTVGNKHLVPIKPLKYQMEFGFNSTLPLCINELFVERQYTSEAASVFIPFTSQEVQQNNAIFYGLNSSSKNMILCNRLEGNNFNGLIFGRPGTGKSFITKCEMVSVLLNHQDAQVFVLDPQGEYYPLANNLHGKVIKIAPGSDVYINPFDLNLDSSEGDPVTEKADFIISMIEIMAGRGSEMTPTARSLVDRCIHIIYEPYVESLRERGLSIDPSVAPTLNTLYNELLRIDSYDARQIAGVIEMYATGSYNTFAHRTNVDVSDERFVVYDTKNLGSGMKKLGMHVCLNDVFNRMITNSKRKVYTWFYIDEFHLFIQDENTTSFLVKIWKMARKWLGVPTGIMQNTEDLLRAASTRAIFNTTSFIIMLSVEKLDRDNLQALLHLSDAQLVHITNNDKGCGLIYNGKIIVPFEYNFPKNTKLYSIMTTQHDVDDAEFR